MIPELILNRLSIDDCAILGRFLFHRSPPLPTSATQVVTFLTDDVLTPAGRRWQVDLLSNMCQDALQRGVELRPAKYPHEMAAAWLVWLKSTDGAGYINTVEGCPGAVDYLPVGVDKQDYQTLLAFTSECARSWIELLSGYAGSDYQRLHRSITACVYPKTRLWSRFYQYELNDLTPLAGGFWGTLD